MKVLKENDSIKLHRH